MIMEGLDTLSKVALDHHRHINLLTVNLDSYKNGPLSTPTFTAITPTLVDDELATPATSESGTGTAASAFQFNTPLSTTTTTTTTAADATPITGEYYRHL